MDRVDFDRPRNALNLLAATRFSVEGLSPLLEC
jgi:hypothetical protein